MAPFILWVSARAAAAQTAHSSWGCSHNSWQVALQSHCQWRHQRKLWTKLPYCNYCEKLSNHMLPYATVIQKRSQSSHKSSFIVLNGEHGTITASTSTSRLHGTSAENLCQAQHLRQRLHICWSHCRLLVGSFRVSYFLFGKCPFAVGCFDCLNCFNYFMLFI